MIIIRGTRKFLDRVGSASEPNSDSTTMLGDWFATLLFWRPQVALFVNATTLLPVFMPLAPAATVLQRFPEALAVVLRAQGVAEHTVDDEVAETTEHHLAKTNNRSVVGVMNEFVHLADWRRDQIKGPEDLTWLSHELARTPCSPLYDRHVSPDHELAAAFAEQQAAAVDHPGPPAGHRAV